MAMTFPLPLASFSDTLKVTALSLHCPAVTEESRTAAGEVIRASLGAALWQGQITLAPATHAPARAVRAALDVLTRAGASFLLTPQAYKGPTSNTTLSGVASNNRDVTLGGAGTVPGDYLSFSYGTNPVRYAFHQVVAGTGATVEVTPPIRPGWAAGTAVYRVKPIFKAVMQSVAPGASVPIIHDGMSFNFIQTLR